MNANTHLVITSIAGSDNPVLQTFAREARQHNVPFVVMGDTKSPPNFSLEGCDFYAIERQMDLPFALAKILPTRHYARKNLGYLIAIAQGAEIIVESDDDNLPLPEFWNERTKTLSAHALSDTGWLNIYRYFTEENVWPRGFDLSSIRNELPTLPVLWPTLCPIQQGLANDNPDVDAIYRLISPLLIKFAQRTPIAMGNNAICPFNSQNTTWFKEAFPLLYLPSHCSFRMTDIWRSFVAQRIAWANGWHVLFHNATVWQERNEHNLLRDFEDEIEGYLQNGRIMQQLMQLNLKPGTENIPDNLLQCYKTLINMQLIAPAELPLLEAWLQEVCR